MSHHQKPTSAGTMEHKLLRMRSEFAKPLSHGTAGPPMLPTPALATSRNGAAPPCLEQIAGARERIRVKEKAALRV